jgi:AraC-like DNA-binding protein
MKPKPPFEPHLALRESVLEPGNELRLKFSGWHLLRVTSGVAYWLHPRSNQELFTGSVLLCSDRSIGVIRASQVSKVLLHCFRLQPERLTGLVSLGEQQFLQAAATDDQYSVRLFDQATVISQQFKRVCERAEGSCFSLRLQLLELFVEAFGNDLHTQKVRSEPVLDATTRLTRMLDEIPPTDLLDLSFADLVREMRCTPRHLSRIFQQVVGMSFRQKQAQVRLMRAQELLTTTESKVIEVALESGFRSPCLFNVMFKRRFGVTPAKWRVQSREGKMQRPAEGRFLLTKPKAEPALALL